MTDPIPEGELPADEVRIVEDGVEARGRVVGRILVARSEEERTLEAQIVEVNRRLDRGHVRADVLRGGRRSGLRVVAAVGEVVGSRQVDAAHVAVGVDARSSPP